MVERGMSGSSGELSANDASARSLCLAWSTARYAQRACMRRLENPLAAPSAASEPAFS
jgi:hypothetical protein